MKMYVWENVLTDCTSGMVCALAPDLETAFALIGAKDNVAVDLLGAPTDVVTEPAAFVVWGGA